MCPYLATQSNIYIYITHSSMSKGKAPSLCMLNKTRKFTIFARKYAAFSNCMALK
jgi:hypothetical protein